MGPASRLGTISLSRRSAILLDTWFARSMISGRLRRFVDKSEACDVVVAIGEADDVLHVSTSPLVDRLVIVTDDAEFDRRLGHSLDQRFLGRVDVLVLVHDQVTQRSVGSLEHIWMGKRMHCGGHHAPVGEETVLVKQCMKLFDGRRNGFSRSSTSSSSLSTTSTFARNSRMPLKAFVGSERLDVKLS